MEYNNYYYYMTTTSNNDDENEDDEDDDEDDDVNKSVTRSQISQLKRWCLMSISLTPSLIGALIM